MNNYKSIESYSSPYSTASDTRSSTTYTSSKSLNDIEKTTSNSNSESIISEASTSIITIPNITTTRCSTDDNEDNDDNDDEGTNNDDNDDEGTSLSQSSDDENTFDHHEYHHHSPQQYSMERSFSDFGSLSTIPEVPTPATPASHVDTVSFKDYSGGKEDSYEISFDDNERKLSSSSSTE
uniref:Uncharacterized protein n=1 Tax=Panagrolaimus sp. ES5 TaxID=591445 RepID=A0AC34FRQ5_9BILA